MKRVFDLGMSVVPVRGFRRHLELTVEFGGQEYRTQEDGYFVISGHIGGKIRWIEGGQCQKTIREICKKKYHALLDELLAFDEKYWLKFCRCIPKNDANRIKEIIKNGR